MRALGIKQRLALTQLHQHDGWYFDKPAWLIEHSSTTSVVLDSLCGRGFAENIEQDGFPVGYRITAAGREYLKK